MSRLGLRGTDDRSGRRPAGNAYALRLLVPGLLLAVAACLPSPIPEGRQAAPTPAPTPSASAEPTAAGTPAPEPTVKIRDTAPTPQRVDSGSRPDRLVISGIDIDLPVVPVGVADDGSMALPATVAAVGWYEFGARPADRSGTTVLAGHVDTRREGLGPLARLRRVDEGAMITLRDRAGDVRPYRVRAVRRIAKQKLPLDQVFARTGDERLVVITCGGPYSPRTGYRDNLIVTAEPV